MRHLNLRRRQRGLTLVELMVGLGIATFLVLTAAPYFSDYMANSRLREGGNLLYAEALIAQSEAVKRNTTVQLETNGTVIRVLDPAAPSTPLRTRRFAGGVTAPHVTIDFGSEGRPIDFAAGSVDLSMTSVTCGSDYRCPGLRVDGGGAVRLCGNHLSGCT